MIESYYGWTVEVLNQIYAVVAVVCVLGFSVTAYLITKENEENE